MPFEYHVALGGNLPSEIGAPAQSLAAAVSELAEKQGRVTAVSRFFATPCFPPGAGPDYVNAAVSVISDLPPADMLEWVHEIEAGLGRERTQRWGMRTLDIDLIAAGDMVLPDAETYGRWQGLAAEDQTKQTPDQLILPHPRLQDRAFVLVPLNDIAPRWRHPVLGLTVAQMLENLDENDVNAVVSL